MKPTILYVDDQEPNLFVFRGNFDDKWDIHTFLDPMEALQKLEQIKPMVIVSDQKGKMPGVDFLQQSIAIVPEAIRIIYTGYSEEELIIEALRKARIHDLIRKPIMPEDVEKRIDAAIALYEETEKYWKAKFQKS